MFKHLEILSDVIRIVTFTRGTDMPRRYDTLRGDHEGFDTRETMRPRFYEGRGPFR